MRTRVSPLGAGAVVAALTEDAELSAALGTKKKLPVDVQGQLGATGAHCRVDLVWTNTSHASCTLRGFGGVDLDGPYLGTVGGPTYSLPRTDADHLSVTPPRREHHPVTAGS